MAFRHSSSTSWNNFIYFICDMIISLNRVQRTQFNYSICSFLRYSLIKSRRLFTRWQVFFRKPPSMLLAHRALNSGDNSKTKLSARFIEMLAQFLFNTRAVIGIIGLFTLVVICAKWDRQYQYAFLPGMICYLHRYEIAFRSFISHKAGTMVTDGLEKAIPLFNWKKLQKIIVQIHVCSMRSFET